MLLMTPWPFRSRLRKALFFLCIAIMLSAALVGLLLALAAGEFGAASIASLTIGLGALLIIAILLIIDRTGNVWHAESGLFTWSDVDNLRELAVRSATDAELRGWARSLADRIAVVLPGRSTR